MNWPVPDGYDYKKGMFHSYVGTANFGEGVSLKDALIRSQDIAKEAGVAQGTVSNVLNGRGNVSSDKIILVEQACAKLGYTMNQRAKNTPTGLIEAAGSNHTQCARQTIYRLLFKL